MGIDVGHPILAVLMALRATKADENLVRAHWLLVYLDAIDSSHGARSKEVSGEVFDRAGRLACPRRASGRGSPLAISVRKHAVLVGHAPNPLG